MKKVQLQDEVVILQSPEEGGWIAHSLRTDQVGYGDSIVEALVDVIKAVDQVCKAAEQDPTLAYLREAPEEIQGLSPRAKPLPKEIYEVACKKVHGAWPDDWDFPRPLDSANAFKTELRELVC